MCSCFSQALVKLSTPFKRTLSRTSTSPIEKLVSVNWYSVDLACCWASGFDQVIDVVVA